MVLNVHRNHKAYWRGEGIAQWLERRTRDWKVAGSNPCRIDERIFFSRVTFLCWLLFPYPFHPRVTAVKDPGHSAKSAGGRLRLNTLKYVSYSLSMWLCMKWYSAWLYGVHRTCAGRAAVPSGTSHASAVSAPLRWIFKNAQQQKKLFSHVESHASAVSLLESGE